MTAGIFRPTYIRKYETGLVQSRENFILPEDAFPVLENAFIWRERIKRKSGSKLLGRLRRTVSDAILGNMINSGGNALFSGNIFTILGLESTASLELGSISVSACGHPWVEVSPPNGQLINPDGGSGSTINYATGDILLTENAAFIGCQVVISFNYFPGLPCMGLRTRDLNNINSTDLIAFDTKYAYVYSNGWQEFIPGTTWTGTNYNFFWTTNYWVDESNNKIFWETNNSGTGGDPIRFTNGTSWNNFAPQIDSAGNLLNQCVAFLPYRGRLCCFNTLEGLNLAGSVNYRQRIRWSAIGTPFTSLIPGVISSINANAWRDDIPGQGGFLDIPTAEDIISVGFVRDNLVIYCESSTWQLRYTGRTIAPFQIEKVNTELGAESTFSAIQFDTSLVGIGDKGVVECDSYQSKRIDIKIPDQVFRFNNDNQGPERVHGIRDFQQRIAYWTYPTAESTRTFPNRRLMYNYENDSWATFIDSYTCLGTYNPQSALKWQDFPSTDPDNTWENLDFPWLNRPTNFPEIVGGNQQGYVMLMGNLNFYSFSSNDTSLNISAITGASPNPTIITCTNHNLDTDQIIEITGIPSGTDFDNLNGVVFQISKIDENNFTLASYNSEVNEFSNIQIDTAGTYVGGGQIIVRDNFKIQSKKFNFLEIGQAINFGYMDILMDTTSNGAITMNVYIDYNDEQPVNVYPDNIVQETDVADPFFNTVIPTYAETNRGSAKNFQRIYCNTRGSFITLEFTLSNSQMNGVEQENDVQIDSQTLYMRPAGRQLARG